ncbi:hypothetical protein NJH83_21155 [Pseudomonas chlororaphis]|uniref:hypothetical protein n=1 Tax=Pseudomonas chlororaphis TaxID=587753 RepID=UPI00209B8909|nr:hypothetical protein [Pseudomonas chlororaphis]MCO7612747.1 hypothetical protein [Pseudomonas chlororaphis]
MPTCRFSALWTLLIAALSCQLLSACSVSGTYPDATQADAAKLRFVANASNVTQEALAVAPELLAGQVRGPVVVDVNR